MQDTIAHRSKRAQPTPGKGATNKKKPVGAVSSEVVFNDKTFTTTTPPRAMAVSRHLVWLSLADGGCEIRNARTSEVVRRFANISSQAKEGGNTGGMFTGLRNDAAKDKNEGSVILSMLAVVTKAGQPQVWLGLANGTIEVHHAETADLLTTLRKHSKRVNCLAEFGGFVYSGSGDHQVIQWRAESALFVRVFASRYGHEGEVLCMYAEGNALVTGSSDCTVKVWDVGSGSMQLTGYFHSQSSGVTSVCRVGENMWTGDKSGQLVIWRLRTCEAVDMLHPHEGEITSLYRAGERVYSGSADGTMGVFDCRSAALLRRVSDQSKGWITTIAATAQLSRFVVWSADADGTVQCWYQDEYVFLNRDHEQLNEAAWYLSGSTPYREFRAAISSRNADLSEQLQLGEKGLASGIIERCRNFLGSSGAHGGDNDKTYDRLQGQMRLVNDRSEKAMHDINKMKEDIQQLDRDLAVTAKLLLNAHQDINLLSPGAGDRLAAALPPIPAYTGGSAYTLTGPSAVPTAAAAIPGVAAPPTAAVPAYTLPGYPVPTGVPGAGTTPGYPPIPAPAGYPPIPNPTIPGYPTQAYPIPGVPGAGAGAGVAVHMAPGVVPLPSAAGGPPNTLGVPLPGGSTVPQPNAPAVVPMPTASQSPYGAVSSIPVPGLGAAAGVPAAQVPPAIPGLPPQPGAVPMPPSVAVPGMPPLGGAAVPAPAVVGVPPPQPAGGAVVGVGSSAQPAGGVPGGAVPVPQPTLGATGLATYPAAVVPIPGAAAAATAVPVAGAIGALPAAPSNYTPVAAGAGYTTLGIPPAAVPAAPNTTYLVGAPGSYVTAPPQAGALVPPPTQPDGAAAAAAAGALALQAADKLWDGVSWVNPNVGNYIQRRYYGASPSLRTPDIDKREKRKQRMPIVKVVPLERGKEPTTRAPSPATGTGIKIKEANQASAAPKSCSAKTVTVTRVKTNTTSTTTATVATERTSTS